MRKKTIIQGFKNSQKFRIIFKGDGSEKDIGMYFTIHQMDEQFATVHARSTCYDALIDLSRLRSAAKREDKSLPVGLGTTIRGRQVQIDLV